MIKNVNFNNQVLIMDTSRGIKEIDLGCKIRQALVFENKVFARFDSSCFRGTEFHNRNIICLDEEGKQRWRVEDPDIYRSGKIKTEAPFTSIRIVDNKLEGGTWDGFDIIIDTETGKLMGDWQFTR